MSLNYKEIDLILNELELESTFIQEVIQPNFDSIAIYTFKPGVPKTVFICLAGGSTRINETRRKITKNEKPLRFNELLKSKIKGARIIACSQIGKERIVKITLERQGAIYVMPKAQEKLQKIQDAKATIVEPFEMNEIENDTTERFNLYIRLWSNAANIFLCDENDIIIDSFYRRPAKNEMSGEKFILPEIKDNGREFEIRKFEEIEQKLLEEQKQKGFSKEITFNQKVDIFYSENAAQTSLEALLLEAEKWYNSHKSRQVAALEKLKEKRESFLTSENLKHQGDLILAFGYLFNSIEENLNFIEVDDWETNEKIKIKINPKKNAQENATEYYERYKKAQSGLENLEHDILISEKAIEELEKQYAQMIAEKNPIKLEQILRKKQTPKQLEKKSHPGLEYLIDGWTIIVGRDAEENDELLRHNVKGFDMWMHTRDYHGGYVFIKNRPGKTIPLEILLYAGNLAVYYSKARKNGSADLYYTQVKYLRRAKNGPKGLVLPTNEKNLFIKLDEAKLRKLDEIQKGIEL